MPAIVEVPMASFEQDLEDDEFLPEMIQQQPCEEWTCKKCTLVNSHRVKACVVCGGSKLKSISAVEDMTLRKGEFWSCAQCTLKNSLSTNTCIACKSVRQVPIISGQQTNFRPYTSSPAQPKSAAAYHHPHQRQMQAMGVTSAVPNVAGTGNAAPCNSLVPPAHRISRSPSPKHDRSVVAASGAIPKVCVHFVILCAKIIMFFFLLFSVIVLVLYCQKQ